MIDAYSRPPAASEIKAKMVNIQYIFGFNKTGKVIIFISTQLQIIKYKLLINCYQVKINKGLV